MVNRSVRTMAAGWLVYGLLMCAPVVGQNYPDWWIRRNIVSTNAANDYALANLGQVKWLLTNLCLELDAKLPGGAGAVRSLTSRVCNQSNNYSAVCSGQLKALVKVVQDRLNNESSLPDTFDRPYPWTSATSDDVNYAPVNVGQLKRAFLFDVLGDTDGDMLSDLDEIRLQTVVTGGDTDVDGMGDGMEVLLGRSPIIAEACDSLSMSVDFNLYPEGAYTNTDPDWWRWTVIPSNAVYILTNVMCGADGALPSRALRLTGTPTGSVRRAFASWSQGVKGTGIWEDYYTIPPRIPASVAPAVTPCVTALYYFNEEGRLVVYDGSAAGGRWLILRNHNPVPADQAVRVTVFQDLVYRKWMVFLNSCLVAANLGFAANLSEYPGFNLYVSGNTTGIYDNIRVYLAGVNTTNYQSWVPKYKVDVTAPAAVMQGESLWIDARVSTLNGSVPTGLVNFVMRTDGGGVLEWSSVGAGSGACYSNDLGTVFAQTDASGHFAIKGVGSMPGEIGVRIENISAHTKGVVGSNYILKATTVPGVDTEYNGVVLDFTSGVSSVSVSLTNLAALTCPAFTSKTWWTIGTVTSRHVRVSRDGCIQFGQVSALAYTPNSLGLVNVSLYGAIIAPYFRPLVMKPNSRVHVDFNVLTEPVLSVQWSHMGVAENASVDLTFQAQIWLASRQIKFAYKNMERCMPPNVSTVPNIGLNLGNGVYTNISACSSWSGYALVKPSDVSIQVKEPDADRDLLVDSGEAEKGLDPNKADTDGDGMLDGWEWMCRDTLNPLGADSGQDPDGDGYSNLVEYYLGTDPAVPNSPTQLDTDKDGLPDFWERQYGLSTNTPDSLVDSDNDWYSNLLEYTLGGNPTNPASHGTHPFEPKGGVSHARYR